MIRFAFVIVALTLLTLLLLSPLQLLLLPLIWSARPATATRPATVAVRWWA